MNSNSANSGSANLSRAGADRASRAAAASASSGASLNDKFWSGYTDLVQNVVIPYQYEALHDRAEGAEPSGAVRNFEIAAGRAEGQFHGWVFQDSDVAKWLEAVGYSLQIRPDADLERRADELIDLIAEAQQPDGYLNTYFTIKEPGKRWTNLTDCHELYCAGHMIEAAVAYYEATGKDKLLGVMRRMVDHIESVFGPEEGKLRGYDGHQEIELALVKLHGLTGEDRYLKLASFFIDERGQEPNFLREEWERRGRVGHFDPLPRERLDTFYLQAHKPVREQSEAVGHAVRAVYMYTAMADLARLNDDRQLEDACRRLWNNVVHKQMYVTGGIGSTHHGEAFTFDYDLPNDTVYAETCASIGLIFFAQRMLLLEPKSEYADVMERALYNNVLGSMSQDGRHYFYVNPLEVWPQACSHNPGRRHVKAERQAWFGCACCPPNVARLLASLNRYVYTQSGDTLYANLYIGSELSAKLGGTNVRISQQAELPWNGTAAFSVQPERTAQFALALRVPGWCPDMTVLVNGEPVSAEQGKLESGYLVLRREWSGGDLVEVRLPMQARLVYADPRLRADAHKAAIQRGPLVYCAESADNGEPVSSLKLSAEAGFVERRAGDLPGGAVALETAGRRTLPAANGEEAADAPLYRTEPPRSEDTTITAVPYYLWGNRGAGEMAVWLPVSGD
ncbi:glycoside hydrolase family 127 protein [Saccharibacillus sp. CPCC 101409]|uniref:glycoside hydrolase family 127 protein n=1 Tax=Saccharibacillus sp. CPCC 101409 TaxID=3058041 RepID=UPI0026731B4D|nr:beta-L-arabinofuranosidase domain-containing protein [Saccharibacillus sp. CPCC 101409]MDO3409104.1 glycoside hydrolase family 127 protein [Saccharibacillus sp. CPCC 101409]